MISAHKMAEAPQAQAPINLPTYPEFAVTEDPEISIKWEEWLEGFEAMTGAMQIESEKDLRKMLSYYIGPQTRKIIKGLDNIGSIDDGDCYSRLKNALNDHFKPKLNRVYGMNTLHQIRQKAGETIDNFHIRVKEKVAAIEIEKLNMPQIVDLITLAHMVNHCQDKRVKLKAIRDDLSLKDFLKIARAAERADYQMKDMEADRQPGAVNKVEGKYRRSLKKENPKETLRNRSKSRQRSKPKDKICYRCGDSYPHKNKCPAMDKECTKCKKKGHFAKMCKTKNLGRVNTVKSDDEDDVYVVPSIVYSIKEANVHWANIHISDRKIAMMIDSGSEINVLSEDTYEKLQDKPPLESDSKKYCGYGPEGERREIPMKGTFMCEMKAPETKRLTQAKVHVMKGKAANLLSCETSEKLGLVKFACKVNESASSVTVGKDKIFAQYPEVFEGMGKMTGKSVKLNINKETKPIAQKARRVPFHLRDKVEQEIERLKAMDIIEDAEGPTPWVSPLVLVHKPNNAIRICIDSRAINTAIERERHPMNTLEELIVDLNGSQYFSKVDLNKGYHQLELDEESRYITTFATHNGLYRYKRLCFGINSAAEIFQKEIADMLRDIPGVKNMSDDIIIFSRTADQHKQTIDKVLSRMKECNITANREKCEFWKDEVTFFGHHFTKHGIAPSKQNVNAVLNAAPPKSPEEVRSLLGMAQYLARFIPDYSTVVNPLRILTHQDVKWRWGKTERKSFEKLKSSMTNLKMIHYFDVNRNTELIVDASPVGLGAVLTQKDKAGELYIVEYASRKLADPETRYSQTEREALGVVWACEHFDHYLVGAEFTVITDHQPLLGIMNKPMSKPTARLQRLCLRLQPYQVLLKYSPGKSNPADYISRHPQEGTKPPSQTWLDRQTEQICISAIRYYTMQEKASISLKEVEEETSKDEILQQVIMCIATQNWKSLNYEMCSEYESFRRIKDELCISDGLLLRGERLVLPESLRLRAVELAHVSHQGIVKTKALIRETVWFPGIDKMVEAKVRDCLACQACTSANQREPLQMSKMPDGPWKEVSVDFTGPFPGGEYILVVVDEYSRFPECEILYSTSTNATLPKLDAIFARQGIPEVVKTDNGPPFNGEQFAAWARYVGFHHRKITPRWPEANAEAERFMRTLNKAVKTAKLEKGSWKQEIFTFLRQYRATPHSTTGLSPSELLNGRKLRTEMPTLVKRKKSVRFEDQVDFAKKRDERLKSYMKEIADDRRNVKQCDLTVGDTVIVKQDKQNKLSTPFNPQPLKITERNGSMITAENNQRSITRNTSHFKKVSKKCGDQYREETSAIDLDEVLDCNDKVGQKEDTEKPKKEDTGKSSQGSTRKLPERNRKQPKHLADYVQYGRNKKK